MGPICRFGDKNIVGGIVVGSAKTVFANFLPVAMVGDFVLPHPKGHKHLFSTIVTGSPTVFCEGRPVARVGSKALCKHPMVTGSFNVFVL
jgi:uncharacterized Zn-binding protein involved in type VI secretion